MRTVMVGLLVLATWVLTPLGVVRAEDAVDPPSRAARLSYVSGDVSLAPAGNDDWAQAVLNRPLTTGDRLWVDQGARAEVQVGSANLYLDEDSGFSFVDLDDGQVHMKLTDGALTVRVQSKRDNESIEIDTPNATVSLLHPGEYHLEVSEAGDRTLVKTRSGASEVYGQDQTYQVAAGEEGEFSGTSQLTADVRSIGPRTAFENWANDRDRDNEESRSARYVSNEVVGYRDLDRYGDWIDEPEYGYVWRPSYVVAGWAPYRFGRWAWVSPWGWNWIDDTPWGFAPFHYGRWAYLRSHWYWVPGPRHIRPVYAPALVGWTGAPGFGTSISVGVGWFPLGPREVYVPGYRYSPRYIRNVNLSNARVNHAYIRNLRNGRNPDMRYQYGRDPHAVTVVDRDRFVAGRPIDGHRRPVNASELGRWHNAARPPQINPGRESMLAGQLAQRPPMGRVLRPDASRPNTATRANPPNGRFERSRDGAPSQPVRSLGLRESPQAAPGASTPGFNAVPRQGRRDDRPAWAHDERGGAPRSGAFNRRESEEIRQQRNLQQQAQPAGRQSWSTAPDRRQQVAPSPRIERQPRAQPQTQTPRETATPRPQFRSEQPKSEQRRAEQPRIEPRRFEQSQPRMESRSSFAPSRATSPAPRAQSPRVTQPRVVQPRSQPQPRTQAAPRMSSPAPARSHQSAPSRQSAPRSFGHSNGERHPR